MSVSKLKMANSEPGTEELMEQRIDLACAFRWAHRLDMHEAVANHFSLAVSSSGSRFLINPDGRHFSRIRASELILVDANDPEKIFIFHLNISGDYESGDFTDERSYTGTWVQESKLVNFTFADWESYVLIGNTYTMEGNYANGDDEIGTWRAEKVD